MSLASCPFCRDLDSLVLMVEGSELGPDHYVYCASCTAHGPSRDEREVAISDWNSRAQVTWPVEA